LFGNMKRDALRELGRSHGMALVGRSRRRKRENESERNGDQHAERSHRNLLVESTDTRAKQAGYHPTALLDLARPRQDISLT
jgi:hypothetical protein